MSSWGTRVREEVRELRSSVIDGFPVDAENGLEGVEPGRRKDVLRAETQAVPRIAAATSRRTAGAEATWCVDAARRHQRQITQGSTRWASTCTGYREDVRERLRRKTTAYFVEKGHGFNAGSGRLLAGVRNRCPRHPTCSNRRCRRRRFTAAIGRAVRHLLAAPACDLNRGEKRRIR